MGGPPPLPLPCWPHVLSVCDRSGDLRSSSSAPCMAWAGSACCRVPSPASVSLRDWLAVPMLESWPSPLTWFPVAAGSTAGPVGASNLCSRRKCVTFLGLMPSVLAVCLCRVPAMSPTAAVTCCGRGGGAVPGPNFLSSSPSLVLYALVSWVVGGVSVPSLPPSVFLRHSLSLGCHSGGFFPPFWS